MQSKLVPQELKPVLGSSQSLKLNLNAIAGYLLKDQLIPPLQEDKI